MPNRNSRLLCFIVAGLAASASLTAQQSSSTLKGRLTDTGSGANKAGVLVIVTNPATGVTRQAKTDSNGLFSFPFIPVGTYQISYIFGGQTYKASRAALLGQEVDASFKWPATTGATVEVVGVSAIAQSVDTTTAQVGTAIGVETLADLPMATRDINAAAVLAPGVSIVSGSNVDPTKKSSSYIMAGEGMGRGTNYAVDGADNNSTDVGGYVLPVPIDAVQELQVVTNQFKAEFGRSNQGFFNLLTKSGTNDFAGILSTQYQNQALRARRTDEGVKKDDNQGIYSATISGPILKDKLFFMVSAEQTNGEAASFDFPANAVALDPTLGGIKYKLTKKNIYAKLDWNPTSRMNTSWTYGYYQDETANQPFPRTTAFNGNVLSTALGTGRNQTYALGGKLTFTITDHLVWESNLHYFDYNNHIAPFNPGPGKGSPLAVLDNDTPNSPRPDQNNLGWGGIDPNALQGTGIKRTQWKNDLSYQAGDHNIRAGIDYSHSVYADTTLFFSETGIYRVFVAGNGVNYANAFTNSTLDADVNVIQVRPIANGFQPGTNFDQWAFYAQDDWTVSPKLSLYAGVRADWDTQLDYLKKYDSMYAEIRKNTLAGSATADPAWNTGVAPKGKKYVSPRFQLTYRPNGDDNFAIKFGAGQFVAQVIDNVTGFSRGLGAKVNGLPNRWYNNTARVAQGYAPETIDGTYVSSFRAHADLGSVNGHVLDIPADLTPYNYANNINGLRDYFRNTVNSWLTTGTADTDGKNLLESDFQYPQTTTFNLGASYRFSERQAIEANLLYSKTKHMTVQISLDGKGPRTEEYDSTAGSIGDNVFFSNQQAESLQLQVKYSFSSPNTNVIATFVFKDQKSSEGGAAGAFDASGSTGGLYGEGARFGWQTNPTRRSPGTERFAGSFSATHRFSWGTTASVLGQWHSGRAYDVTQGYNNIKGQGKPTDTYHPIELLGTQEGMWALELDMKISQKFQLSKKVAFEPFISVQNLLNQYDYGSNYDGQKILNSGALNSGTGAGDGFGTRGPAFQANSPRMAVVGLKVTF